VENTNKGETTSNADSSARTSYAFYLLTSNFLHFPRPSAFVGLLTNVFRTSQSLLVENTNKGETTSNVDSSAQTTYAFLLQTFYISRAPD
jgi:hypothetical protein